MVDWSAGDSLRKFMGIRKSTKFRSRLLLIFGTNSSKKTRTDHLEAKSGIRGLKHLK